MGTTFWSGEQTANAAEVAVPGSVARYTLAACYLHLDRLRETMEALRTGGATDFAYLINLCGADYWDHFEVVYHLQSFTRNQLACIKVDVWDREDPVVPSLAPVWQGAWMQECEAYDMFGIRFDGNPRLHRILLWEGFPGWPLRKDFLSMPGGLQPGLNEFAGVAPQDPPPVRPVI